MPMARIKFGSSVGSAQGVVRSYKHGGKGLVVRTYVPFGSAYDEYTLALARCRDAPGKMVVGCLRVSYRQPESSNEDSRRPTAVTAPGNAIRYRRIHKW